MPKLIFKDEGDENGEPVGPVTLIADGVPETWPYGSTPTGVEELGWMSVSEAQAEAKRRGLALEQV